MSFHDKYFTKKYGNVNRVLFLMAQVLFTIGSLVNYYYVEPTIIKKRELILSFIEFLGAFCMLLFQYKAKWLRGTIIMCVACMVSAFVFLDLLFLYIKKNTDLL
jgi:hypothetical protein